MKTNGALLLRFCIPYRGAPRNSQPKRFISRNEPSLQLVRGYVNWYLALQNAETAVPLQIEANRLPPKLINVAAPRAAQLSRSPLRRCSVILLEHAPHAVRLANYSYWRSRFHKLPGKVSAVKQKLRNLILNRKHSFISTYFFIKYHFKVENEVNNHII